MAKRAEPKEAFQVIVLSGLSGAGKTTALRVFEDMRFFCVDGLPASLVPKLVGLYRGQTSPVGRGMVLGMDTRQTDFINEWARAVGELRADGLMPRIIFIEAKPEILVRRYATTRRPHPLESQELGLEQAIEEEGKRLSPIRSQADLVIDTSEYSIHDLRRILQEKWTRFEGKLSGLHVHVLSFGYKHGSPIEADLMFDLRFLPNPYFEDELKHLTGKSEKVSDYVLHSKIGEVFLQRFLQFIHFLLPLYAEEGRYRLTVAVGCTGGRHRSVAVSEVLFESIRKAGYEVTLEHRHIELE